MHFSQSPSLVFIYTIVHCCFLGAHALCEMSLNFSSGSICRYCHANHKDACEDGNIYEGLNGYEPGVLTREWYNKEASKAEAGEQSALKGHCVFNQTKAFHCVGQTPPCLGHDYFEGVVAYDIQMYLQFIVNTEKLISISELNSRIKNIPLSSRDSGNRPKEFKVRKPNSKYEGIKHSLFDLGVDFYKSSWNACCSK